MTHMRKDLPAERDAIREKILDAWYHGGLPGGPTITQIADLVGRAIELVNGVIGRARQRGDPRAVKRSAGGIPTKADRARRATSTDDILNLRSSDPEIRSIDIARKLDLSVDVVRNIISDERFKGDVRAQQRTPAWKSEHADPALPGPRMDAPLLCPELGIRSVVRRMPTTVVSSANSGLEVRYVDVSVARLSFLDGPLAEEVPP